MRLGGSGRQEEGFVAVAAFVVFFTALGWKFARGEGAWEVAE